MAYGQGGGFYPKEKSGAQRGLEEKMAYWKQKDVLTEFNILTAQALNLALEWYKDKTLYVEDNYKERKDEYLKETAVMFFDLLLQLRKDEGLKAKFEEYKSAS